MATQAQVKAFILEIAPCAQMAYKLLGKVLPSVAIGMACVESGYGTKEIMRSHNAFMGHKVGTGKTATKYWTGTFFVAKTKEEYTVGTHTVIQDAFRSYPSMEICLLNFYELLNTSLYSNVKATLDYRQQMKQIKARGYMTSSTEVDTVLKIIASHNLTQYDNVVGDIKMSKTGKELAKYAKGKVGTPYFYGSKMTKLTESYMSMMHNMYPNVVTQTYMQKARNKGMVGKICVDCSGLIYGYTGKNLGSSQLYQQAYTRLNPSEFDKWADGVVVWRKGHVGVFFKEGNKYYVAEAKGIDHGVVISPFKPSDWRYGLTFSWMQYKYDTPVISGKTWKGENPFKEPVSLIQLGSLGNGVKWVQWELNEAGYGLTIDGDFGSKTHDAVIDFQKSCKIEVDGIVGNITRSFLKAR